MDLQDLKASQELGEQLDHKDLLDQECPMELVAEEQEGLISHTKVWVPLTAACSKG